MFILPPICSSSGFWSVNHISIHKNSESEVVKNMKFLDEISSDWPKDLLETNVYKMVIKSWISDIEYDPSSNSNFPFHVGTDILVYCFYMTF